jgi:hypothetical protein
MQMKGTVFYKFLYNLITEKWETMSGISNVPLTREKEEEKGRGRETHINPTIVFLL